MFLQWQRKLMKDHSPLVVFDLSPAELLGMLEESWVRRYLGANGYSQSDDQQRSRLSSANPRAMRATFAGWVLPAEDLDLQVHQDMHYYCTPEDTVWDHLVFAYLLETTYMYEIFARVVFEYVSGLRRDVLNPDAQRWLTSTEALFFTHPLPYSVMGLTSDLQRDIRAIRARDYARMFGVPVSHPLWNGQPYPRPVTGPVNGDFVPTLEEFLREAWIGVANADNSSGAKETDDAAITRLARRLFDMMTTARRYGSIDRHEFVHVSTFAWMYLTVLYDSPIIKQLKAEGSSPFERLSNVAARVGLAPHSRTEQFFALADSLPVLLRVLELGTLNDPGMAEAVYQKDKKLPEVVKEVIANWSIATGRDLKAAATTATRIRTELTSTRYAPRTRPAGRDLALTAAGSVNGGTPVAVPPA